MSKTVLGYADVTLGRQGFREGPGPDRGLVAGCGFTWLSLTSEWFWAYWNSS